MTAIFENALSHMLVLPNSECIWIGGFSNMGSLIGVGGKKKNGVIVTSLLWTRDVKP
jgi:hypothetical protein